MSTMVKSSPPSSAQERRAVLAERLRQAAGAPKTSPLSFAQERLWFLDQLEPNSPLYNITTVARLSGTLDVEALRRSLNVLVERHESLRTRIISANQEPAQVVEEKME